MDAAPSTLTEACKDLEAFQTDAWAVESLVQVELLTSAVVDPCVGLGAIAGPLMRRGHHVRAFDIKDWTKVYPDRVNADWLPFLGLSEIYYQVLDFLRFESLDLSEATVMMNPPFSLACEFVDKCKTLNARKIVCFQRQAWRESDGRREWWEQNRPSRVWVCGARASCWRFDLLGCQHADGFEECPNRKKRAAKELGCARCLGNSPTPHAWYVWERGHTGAEITSTIFPNQNWPEKESPHG